MTPDELRKFAEKLRLVEAVSHSEAVQLAATRRILGTAADAWEDLEKRFTEEVEWDNKRADKLASELEGKYDEVLALRKRLEACEEKLVLAVVARDLAELRLEEAEKELRRLNGEEVDGITVFHLCAGCLGKLEEKVEPLRKRLEAQVERNSRLVKAGNAVYAELAPLRKRLEEAEKKCEYLYKTACGMADDAGADDWGMPTKEGIDNDLAALAKED